MKPELHFPQICTITLFCVISLTSYAQVQELMPTDSPTSQSSEVNSNESEEKASKLLITTEKDSTVKNHPSKTKLNIEPSKPEKVKEEVKEDDSILSFNFIYYIIKKFKLSDIIDH